MHEKISIPQPGSTVAHMLYQGHTAIKGVILIAAIFFGSFFLRKKKERMNKLHRCISGDSPTAFHSARNDDLIELFPNSS